MTRLVFAVGALAALALSLTGCGGDTPPIVVKPIPPIGGFYTDPQLFDPTSNTFAGLYVISDRQADELTKKLHFIGSDDGKSFWNVHGEWTDEKNGKLVAYFSHRGTDDPDLHGTLSDSGISWNTPATTRDPPRGRSQWAPIPTPSFNLKSQSFKDASTVGGFYVEQSIYKKGQDSFAGVRLIGANYFPNISFVGTDDGTEFWSITGNWDKTPGQFKADFTAIGRGNKNTTGIIDHDAILWSDGQAWQKEGIGPDVPVIPPTITV